MAEESKTIVDSTQKAQTNNEEDDVFFINEDNFDDVVPEFGTCGGGTNDIPEDGQENDSKTKSSPAQCTKGQSCCKKESDCSQETSQSKDNTTKDLQDAEESKGASEPAALRNPCYKCKEKSAKYKNKSDMICGDCL